MVTIQLGFIVAGLLAELVGIGFAVWEVRQRRTYVRDYRISMKTVHGRLRGTALPPTGSFTGKVTGDEPPTVEQRLDALEAGLVAVRGEVTNAERRAVESAEAYTDEVARDVIEDAQREVGAMRALLLRATDPNWQVWASLVLLMSGVVLQSIASAWAVISR